jgi:hypothetical protein
MGLLPQLSELQRHAALLRDQLHYQHGIWLMSRAQSARSPKAQKSGRTRASAVLSRHSLIDSGLYI